jgi:hypothetical protein
MGIIKSNQGGVLAVRDAIARSLHRALPPRGGSRPLKVLEHQDSTAQPGPELPAGQDTSRKAGYDSGPPYSSMIPDGRGLREAAGDWTRHIFA